jgi:hypothetical protein
VRKPAQQARVCSPGRIREPWVGRASAKSTVPGLRFCDFVELRKTLGRGPSGELGPQLTAFFTSAPIFASSAAVNPFSAKATGHRASSSRFAASLKPNVAYLVLNF